MSELIERERFELAFPELAEIGRDLAEYLSAADAEALRIDAQTAKQLKEYILHEHGQEMYAEAARKYELHNQFTEYVLHLTVIRGLQLDAACATLYKEG